MGFIDTAYVCIHLCYLRQEFQERKKKSNSYSLIFIAHTSDVIAAR